MRTVEFPWQTWRAIIAFLRATDQPHDHEHDDILEGTLDQMPAGQPIVPREDRLVPVMIAAGSHDGVVHGISNAPARGEIPSARD